MRTPRQVLGGYYALVGCILKPVSAESGSTGIGAMLSTVLLVNAGRRGLYSRVRVNKIELSLHPGGSSKSRWQVRCELANSGNTHARLSQPLVTISTSSDQLVDSARPEIGAGFVLPAAKRVWRAEGTVALPQGRYKVGLSTLVSGQRTPMRVFQAFDVAEGRASLAGVGTKSGPVGAEVSYVLRPASAELVIPPGGRRRVSFEVANLSNKSLELRATPAEWDHDDGGHPRLLRSGIHVARATAWMSGVPGQVVVPAQRNTRVAFTVTMPRSASAGDRYLALALAPVSAADATPDVSVDHSLRMVVRLPGPAQPECKVEQFTISKRSGGGVQFEIAIGNTGSSQCTVAPLITVSDSKGVLVEQGITASSPVVLLAGEERRFVVGWPRVLSPGTYRAALSVSAEVDQAVTRLDSASATFKMP
jgi:hypothetical protein